VAGSKFQYRNLKNFFGLLLSEVLKKEIIMPVVVITQETHSIIIAKRREILTISNPMI